MKRMTCQTTQRKPLELKIDYSKKNLDIVRNTNEENFMSL